MSNPDESKQTSPWWRLPWDMLREHLAEWRLYRKQAVLFLLVVGALSAAFMPFDAELSALLSPEVRGGWVNELARGFSYWGDFLTFCIPVGALLFLGGTLAKRIPWQRAGVACLLGACIAGLTADLIQMNVGRARPRNNEATGIHGFTTNSEYHSFPSGHSATAFGSATALAVCYPPAAVPLLLGASGVAWSRVYLGAHYPSDIVMGSGLGLIFGCFFGLAARRNTESK
jgi:membrane-associated phospholipid phosphatase